MKQLTVIFLFTILYSSIHAQWTTLNGNVIYTSGEDVEIRDASSPELRFFDTNTNLEDARLLMVGNDFWLEALQGDAVVRSGEDIRFGLQQGAVSTSGGIIKNNGNWGIGTINPQA